MEDKITEFYENGNLKKVTGFSASETVDIINVTNSEKRKNNIINVAMTIIKQIVWALFCTTLFGITQIHPTQFIKQMIIVVMNLLKK